MFKNVRTCVSGVRRTVLFVVIAAIFDSNKNDTILQEESDGYKHHKTEQICKYQDLLNDISEKSA